MRDRFGLLAEVARRVGGHLAGPRVEFLAEVTKKAVLHRGAFFDPVDIPRHRPGQRRELANEFGPQP
jgi:hypothetical protein